MEKMKIKILVAPSILSANQNNLAGEAKRMEKAGADLLHVDVMDGRFVPRVNYSPATVKLLSKATKLPLDVHLMVFEPWKLVKEYAKAGAKRICVHAEAGSAEEILKTLKLIRASKCKAGIAIKPPTPLQAIDPRIFKHCDFLMPMSVNPGASGQPFLQETIPKILHLQQILSKMNLKKELEADGGISASTAHLVTQVGVTVLVSGAGIFNAMDAKSAVMQLKQSP